MGIGRLGRGISRSSREMGSLGRMLLQKERGREVTSKEGEL